jgi:hypothetical protein
MLYKGMRTYAVWAMLAAQPGLSDSVVICSVVIPKTAVQGATLTSHHSRADLLNVSACHLRITLLAMVHLPLQPFLHATRNSSCRRQQLQLLRYHHWQRPGCCTSANRSSSSSAAYCCCQTQSYLHQ